MSSEPVPSKDQLKGNEHMKDDLLEGAAEIAGFLYGNCGHRRKIYHLAQTSRFPVFRLGTRLCARRSTLEEWITKQEQHGWKRGA
jgi:hypothetical protein